MIREIMGLLRSVGLGISVLGLLRMSITIYPIYPPGYF
ncbi:Inner membrane component of tripartite multidrug resistance system [Crocosphaera watsonii WH 0402]|uniref:Inner membrane component of tripartite multidrug resistance system n=1 Tax=Crocosphaera watsonii WH 0402 TaxID=1284629 RepID=T2K0G6_CROWT|nr:Inner membrane component of tripartite multidrug resistance system [Crocosphaera watsonii WH 0402]